MSQNQIELSQQNNYQNINQNRSSQTQAVNSQRQTLQPQHQQQKAPQLYNGQQRVNNQLQSQLKQSYLHDDEN